MNKNIAEINNLPDKSVIDEVQVTIQTAYAPAIRGQNKTVTDYKVIDSAGGSIKMSFFGVEHSTYQSGQALLVKSNRGKGVVVNSYQGKNSITVFDNASVSPMTPGGAPAPQAPAPVAGGGFDPFTGLPTPPPAAPAAPAAPTPQPPAQALPPQAGAQLSLQEMSDIFSRAYITYRDTLVRAGVGYPEACAAAANAPRFVSAFWFGKDPAKTSGL
tara:strand:+ start:556 stop:1200 length:645 start_codon:yes stop_codon:yes gene_type:complete